MSALEYLATGTRKRAVHTKQPHEHEQACHRSHMDLQWTSDSDRRAACCTAPRKVRLDLVQAENRSFKSRINTVTGATGNRQALQSPEKQNEATFPPCRYPSVPQLGILQVVGAGFGILYGYQARQMRFHYDREAFLPGSIQSILCPQAHRQPERGGRQPESKAADEVVTTCYDCVFSAVGYFSCPFAGTSKQILRQPEGAHGEGFDLRYFGSVSALFRHASWHR